MLACNRQGPSEPQPKGSPLVALTRHRAITADMSLPPRHPQTVPYVDESIRRRAAKSSVSFIELLEQSNGYDDDIDSIASSIGKEDQENVEGLEFLESSGYLQRKKARRRKRRKRRNQWRDKKQGQSTAN